MSNQEASITIRAYDKASYAVLGVAANLETLSKKMQKTSQIGYAFSQLGKQLAPALDSMRNLGAKWSAAGSRLAITGLAVGGATAGLIGFAKSAADAADKIGDLSSRYQISSETLQVYGSLVEEAGYSVDDAAAGIGKFKKAMHEAITTNNDARLAFAGVGISLQQLKKLSPEEAMIKMSAAFKGSNRDMAKQAVLLELMGKNGTIYMDVMNKGPEEIKKRLAEMRADGRILSQAQLADADRFDKAWRRMTGTLEGVKNKLGLRLAVRLEDQLKKFQGWLEGEGGTKLSEGFDKIFTDENIKAFADTLLAVGQVVVQIGKGFKSLVDTIGPANTVMLGLAVVFAPVIAAVVSTAGALFSAGSAVIRLTGLMPGLSAGLGNVGGMLAKLAPLAAAAFAGWAIGGALNEKINEKIQQSTGGRESSLGGWIYGRTHNEDMNSKEFGQFSWRKAITGQEQNIKNTIDIKIDAEGRARVSELKSGSANTIMNASTGLVMAGG